MRACLGGDADMLVSNPPCDSGNLSQLYSATTLRQSTGGKQNNPTHSELYWQQTNQSLHFPYAERQAGNKNYHFLRLWYVSARGQDPEPSSQGRTLN